MFDSGINNAILNLKYQKSAAPIINRGLQNNINSSDFRQLYGNTLTAEQGQAMAGLAEMVMMNSTLSLAMEGGASTGGGMDGSMLSRLLSAALSNSKQSGAANFSALPQSLAKAAPQTLGSISKPSTQTQTKAPVKAESADKPYDVLIKNAATKHGLDPNLIKAVVTAESDFNPQVVSKAGAMGLMQLMPGTAKDMGVENPFDPAQNIDGGSKYLAAMIDRFDGDMDQALAAYNWGPSNVEKGGTYPSETRRYLKKVAAFKEMYAQGFSASA
jgi:soluble lytic murein transglycosylase-like protein